MSARHLHRDQIVKVDEPFDLPRELDLTKAAIHRFDPLSVPDPLKMAEVFEDLANSLAQAIRQLSAPVPVQDPAQLLVKEIVSQLDPVSREDPRVASCLLLATKINSVQDLEKIIQILEDLQAKREKPTLYNNGKIDPIRFIESNSLEDKIDAVKRFAHLTDPDSLSKIIVSSQPKDVHIEILHAINRGLHADFIGLKDAAKLVWSYVDGKAGQGLQLDSLASFVFREIQRYSGENGPKARMHNLVAIPKV